MILDHLFHRFDQDFKIIAGQKGYGDKIFLQEKVLNFSQVKDGLGKWKAFGFFFR